MASLERRGIAAIDSKRAKEISKTVEDLRIDIKNSNKKLWDNYINDAKAKLHTFDEKDSISVFESYFDGGKPFKSLKSRIDIPDAFIYMTVKRIAKKEVVHLISGDKNLRDKCIGEINIVVHESFQHFYISKEHEDIASKYKMLLETEKIQFSINLLLDYKYIFEKAVREYTDNIDFVELYETSLCSDGSQATILAIDDPKLIIKENEIDYLNNEFHIPIIVKASASVEYTIFKGDYWAYENSPKYLEDINDHYFLLEDIFPIVMKKTIIINEDDFSEDKGPLIEINEFDEIKLHLKKENLYHLMISPSL